MADVYFKCACGKSLAVDEAGIGMTVLCVDCRQPVIAPEPEIQFACEHCRSTMLAPLAVAGDRIKCTLCAYRMTVPEAASESNVHAEQTLSAPKRCMDNLMRRRIEFKVLRAPKPVHSGSLFRFAMLAAVLVVAAEITRWVVKTRSPVPAARETVEERVLSAHESATESPAQEAIVTAVVPERTAGEIHTSAVSDDTAESSAFIAELPSVADVHLVDGDLTEMQIASVAQPPPVEEAQQAGLRESEPDRQPVAIRAEAQVDECEEVKLLMEKAAALPQTSEERYALLREIHFMKRIPALRELSVEAQKLNALVNYRTGSKQSNEFFEQLRKCTAQLEEYTRTHVGKDMDEHYWGSAYSIVHEHAIRTARDYREAEKILHRGWALLDEVEPERERTVPRIKLSLGLNMAQSWVEKNTLECAKLFDELEEMAMETGVGKVRDIWGPNARSLHTRFMKYAGNVPVEQRNEFIERHKQRLEKRLLDDSTPRRNRATALRGWIVFLDKHGSLTDALPVINEWQERYGNEPLEMNYYFARFWVEIYGEGDWEKASRTVRLATREAQNGGGKLFDAKNYAGLINLYYDLQHHAGYELQRQRAIQRTKEKG